MYVITQDTEAGSEEQGQGEMNRLTNTTADPLDLWFLTGSQTAAKHFIRCQLPALLPLW